VSFSALISFLLAFLRAFLSGEEAEWLLSFEDEGLEFGGLAQCLSFFAFFVAAGAGAGVDGEEAGLLFLPIVAGVTTGGDRCGEAGKFPLGLPSQLGELVAVPSCFEPAAALSLEELAVESS
jgi:hypothetical protein